MSCEGFTFAVEKGKKQGFIIKYFGFMTERYHFVLHKDKKWNYCTTELNTSWPILGQDE